MAHNPEEPCAKHPPWGCQRAPGGISNQFCSHPMAACSLPAHLPWVRVRGSRAAVSKPYQSHSGKMLVTGNINLVLLQLSIANFSFLMLFSCLHGLSIITSPRSTNKDKVWLWSAPACWLHQMVCWDAGALCCQGAVAVHRYCWCSALTPQFLQAS